MNRGETRQGSVGVARSRAVILGLWVVVLIAGCSVVDSLLPGMFTHPTATPTITPTRTATLTCTPTTTATATLTPVPTVEALRLLVQFDPSPVRQGGTVLINLSASRPITVTGVLGERPLFFASRDQDEITSDEAFAGAAVWAVAGVAVTESTGALPLQLAVRDDLGREATTSLSVTVVAADFGSEVISIPADRQDLLDPQVTQKESALLSSVYERVTEQQIWQGPFVWPHVGNVTSGFGLQRTYNDGRRNGYHGGVDISGQVGAPVAASAAGRVVMATALAVRGNTIVLDHGIGVYSGYCHLATIEVVEGQMVDSGAIIGRLGNTGLSTGAHLHWEMVVGGVLVDPREWTEREIPGMGVEQ